MRAPSASKHALLIGAVALMFLAVDQVMKAVAVAHFASPQQVLGTFLQFWLTKNCGAAWSFGTGMTWIFTVLAVGATLVIAWFTPRCRNAVWAIALGLVLAGVDGNLVDRLFRAPGGGNGCVVDFIAFPHYPIFNVADMCINVGAVVIVVQLYRGIHLNGTRTAKKARP
ncbi:hypothetical protein Back2_26220 [Nocardioides baekrokdamisoli]|uniref:Lipoprotein signal peptidase n=1 Tax=Nocardioides baekrokdamisoli TaxID=1804624 RepID=A0A3G9IQJ6_9ACTN|nr:signal peptidase II [Nocardioides baekrokdamisoli]BBH18335.1 hypothetical protein Back2_26220 [Nocardioides baekrokdamisoli]